jgi:hypothetical protein
MREYHGAMTRKTRLSENMHNERRKVNFPPHIMKPPPQMKYQQELAFKSGI